MPKLVLFDIDGTLVLTDGAGRRALNRAFRRVFAVSEGFEGIAVAGRTDQLIVSDALARLPHRHEPSLLDRFWEEYYALLQEELEYPSPRKAVMPGVRRLLDELSRRPDVFLALLTGNMSQSARIKLQHFDLWRYFRCGAFGDDAVEREHLVNVAMQRVGSCGGPACTPADILIVGDTPLDVACARAAGARAVAVATGPFDRAALEACGADVVFDDLRDLEGFLELLD